MLLTLPDVPLLSAPFSLDDRWLLWSRIQMYPDRLILAGWSFSGRHRRTIALERIDRVDYGDGRMRLRLESGETVALIMPEAARWAQFIQLQQDVYDG